ncbi:glycoside hydrolase family 3 C-terminal domain-containing protein [Streptomyces sp. KK5PA1]|uniref:Glycoside hydrolase family 3 C-terminal domain-containing protein n=2 Tax=Actinacidiphila acididurans TaxID=2784346 RepID=A0ABS2U168_9ACTN|nr:glycoside hydrolase family 3 C-terminal domain-containing protein [Actinacidiphila acididurans]
MTLDDKLTMIAGQVDLEADPQYQAGYLAGIPRLGIPSLKLTDGPPGVITKQDSTGMTATMGVAATFSRKDARLNGAVVGRDAKALGQDVVLEPFVNIDRDTTGGRGFNTFGEDPYLTGQMGAEEIKGTQSQGTMAQVKHYIAYDGANDVTVDEQTLHEIYLAPFQDAVDAGVSSVMCSYNKVNGAQACGNQHTLTDILRGELGFKGFVTSDWGANHGTDYINDGLDLEMPGQGYGNTVPGRTERGFPAYFGKDALKAAVADGTVTESRITQAAGRILYEYDRFGLLDGSSKHTVTAEDRAADDAAVQKTSEDAATLLKNDADTLPLSGTSSVALIGPGAGRTVATDGGGERSGGIASEQTGTYQALEQQLGARAHLSYAVGDDMTGVPVPASALSHDGTPGLQRTDTAGTVQQTDPQLDFTTAGHAALPAGSDHTWTGTLDVPAAGSYWLNIQTLGAWATLTVDGKLLTNIGGGYDGQAGPPRYGTVHATDGNGPLPTTDGLANGRTFLDLSAGPHTLQVVQHADVSGRPVQVRLNWVTPQEQKAQHDAAVAAAASAKTAVVFAWAGSGDDLSKPLPEGQDQLIEDVAAVNPDTVVVLNTGQPVAMPWLPNVKSVLEMWYSGDRGGRATADVLLGRTDPAGKLPFTWPAAIDQELAHQAAHPERSSRGVNGKTTYSEGVDVGYRFFQATGETPLFPFGYGLSYTSFHYSGLRVAPAHAGGLDVTFRVSNDGRTAGDAVPQVYLGAPDDQPQGVQFAPEALAGFDRVHLNPGQARTVTIRVAPRQLQYWSTAAGRWTTATGTRTVHLSTSSGTDALRQQVTVTG